MTIGHLFALAFLSLVGAGAGVVGGSLGLSAGGIGVLVALAIVATSYGVKGLEAHS